MKNLKTISNQKIQIRSNKTKRTYTIVTNGSKYKTYVMSKQEFNDNYYNTGNDWKNFLNNGDYYIIK